MNVTFRKLLPLAFLLCHIYVESYENYTVEFDDSTCYDSYNMSIVSVVNWGSYNFLSDVLERLKIRGNGQVLMLGGSITATLPYYNDLKEELELNYNLSFVNRAHGGTISTYALYCIKVEDLHPDIVFIEYYYNNGKLPLLDIESLIRKMLLLDSTPLIVLLNFEDIGTRCYSSEKARGFLQLSTYYDIPMIDFCYATHHCFGRNPKLHKFYTTDGVHPNLPASLTFLNGIMRKWWHVTEDLIYHKINSNITKINNINNNNMKRDIPSRLFEIPNDNDDIRVCSSLNNDAPIILQPIYNKGFHEVIRTKDGPRGFPIKDFKKCWETDHPGN
jgi:hypothetical protein